jgi:pyruvate,orthophosphate dikinase
VRRLAIYANANTPAEAIAAFAAGAKGVGLVRTEHMFLEPTRLLALRRAILGEDVSAFTELQHRDFVAWLEACGDRPCRIRLLDAPLAEFLPHDRPSAAALAADLALPVDELVRRVDREQPADRLMALRALRLSVVRPDLERAQLTALTAAWRQVKPGAPLTLIVPMVSGPDELAAAITRIKASTGDIPLELSAMMELPRAVFRADAIARQVASFSWGSNDLTQFSLGLGRDVAAKIMPPLIAARAYDFDPSQSLDLAGVGRLIAHGERLGRAANPALRTGICGRLAADRRSIGFFARIGLDFLSVPPGQVAATRLAAAQAAIALDLAGAAP